MKFYIITAFFCLLTTCGFTPLYKGGDVATFKKISIESEKTLIGYLIEEALEKKADFGSTKNFLLILKPAIKNSYGVITKENEITRYSVTLKVDYQLINNQTKDIVFNDSVSATSDYSAAVTYTGFATEIARKDTYERLASVVAEKIITKILIKFSENS